MCRHSSVVRTVACLWVSRLLAVNLGSSPGVDTISPCWGIWWWGRAKCATDDSLGAASITSLTSEHFPRLTPFIEKTYRIPYLVNTNVGRFLQHSLTGHLKPGWIPLHLHQGTLKYRISTSLYVACVDLGNLAMVRAPGVELYIACKISYPPSTVDSRHTCELIMVCNMTGRDCCTVSLNSARRNIQSPPHPSLPWIALCEL